MYASHSSTLVPGLTLATSPTCSWDRKTGTTTASEHSGELNALVPAISGDGQHLLYEYGELDGINGPYDIYLWDATHELICTRSQRPQTAADLAELLI